MDPDPGRWRPTYHFSPDSGWMNDPTGLIYDDGVYHLFYQAGKDRRRWDHATSTDLLAWTEHGTKIPDTSVVEAFSGGGVIDRNDTAGFGEDILVCMYTGYHEDGIEDQRVAYSTDGGATLTTYEGNPVIGSETGEFRDPNPFRYGAGRCWKLAVSRSKPAEGRPAGVEFYSSEDLLEWSYESTYRAPNGEEWECPSLFECPVTDTKETRWVLIVSPRDLGAAEYHIGRFDGTAFTAEEVIRADYGFDFYATQCWTNASENGEVTVSWMNNWAYAMEGPDPGWQGVMTIPRTITLVEGGDGIETRQRPVDRAAELRRKRVEERSTETLAPGDPLRTRTEAPAAEVLVTVAPHAADGISLRVREGPDQETVISYNVGDERLRFDRTNAGAFFDDAYGTASMPLEPLEDGTIELRVLIDRCSIELFANGGRRTMTNLVYPEPESTGISVVSEGGATMVEEMTVYDLALP